MPDTQQSLQALQQNWTHVVASFQQNSVTMIGISICLACLITAFCIFMHVFLTWVHKKSTS